MDWAGTSIDYGCFAPIAAFVRSFGELGIDIKPEEARRPMGLNKKDHIRALFEMERIRACFCNKYGREYNETDVQKCYDSFRKLILASLREYTDSIPHVIEVVEKLREQGIKIGSTTGYTKEMMDIVIPEAEAKGLRVDHCVTADGLPGGRPFPYMIYKNMCDLAVPSRFSVLKYGDTISDIEEGVHAGVWSVGVVMGGNEQGLSLSEVYALPVEELQRRVKEVRMRMYAAGAHYVVDSAEDLPALIESINDRMRYSKF